MSRRRRARHGAAQVGAAAVGPELQRVIDGLAAKLARSGVKHDAVELDYRTVTFVFNDVTAESVVKAGELLPSSQEVAGRRYYFATRTVGRDVDVGGQPFAIERQIESLTQLLERNDAAPVGYRYEPDALTFRFHTPFRRDRAQALLPPSFEVDGRPIYIYTALRDDVVIGQVAGTAQETPWTCGPAALRAVLAHHGDDVDEDTLAVLAGNVPVLGVRPPGMVKAARDLGYYVNATVLSSVDALAPFLAHDLPVLVVVDSFNHPGRAGHWVVVTALEGDKVRLMDPHTPGNWRVLPRAELDTRWWHREQGRVVRRFALIVVPQHMVADDVAVGADKLTHGRTAHLVYKGMPKWLDVMGKVQKSVTKALVTAFSGGVAAKAVDAVQDQLMSAANKMNAKEFATWLNNATNEEVAALRLGQVRKLVKESKGDKSKLLGRLGLTSEALDGPIEGALTALLREELFAYGTAPMVPPQQSLHFLQACAILLYGVNTLPLLDERLKSKPKVKDWKNDPGLTTFLDWSNVTLAVLDKYAEDHAQAPKEFA